MKALYAVFILWLSTWSGEAHSLPLDVDSKTRSCLLYKFAPNLSETPNLKNLPTAAYSKEPFAVLVDEKSRNEAEEYVSSNEIKSANVEVCRGRSERKSREQFYLHAVFKENSYEEQKPLLFIVPSEGMVQLSRIGNTTLWITCSSRQGEFCLDISRSDDATSDEAVAPLKLYRRNAVGHMTPSKGSRDDNNHRHRNVTLGVVISVVGLLVLVLVVALCAGGSHTYDPVNSQTGGVTLQKQSTGEVAMPDSPQEKATSSVTVTLNVKNSPPSAPKTNGSLSSKEPEGQPQEPSGDSEPKKPETPPVEKKDFKENQEDKTRSLSPSARSYDPLPEIPGDDDKKKGEEDDEAGYDYARFPQRNDERMQGSDSEEGEGDEPSKQPAAAEGATSGLPPYGKVTRHSPTLKKDNDEYAEVRETAFIPPSSKRGRSATDPAEPDSLALRDKRAFTESATHLPLPAIPQARGMAEENGKPKVIRERLYECVDEMEGNEDMYESVPDDLKKPDSPLPPLTPTNPSTFPLKMPPPPSTAAPLPPSSPIPSKHHDSRDNVKNKPDEKKPPEEKKALEKTLSAADSEKRRFSFFNRKKTGSVSNTRQKKEKDKDHTQQPSSPVAPPSSSPPHVSPPPVPNIPAPAPPPLIEDEEDDTMYDTPKLDLLDRLPSDPHLNSPSKGPSQDVKAKSASLPANMRSAGASVLSNRQRIPLPDLPETSGGGTVTVVHKRVLEEQGEGEKTGPYDLIEIREPNNIDEPNYDTVNPEEILQAEQEITAEADPGYDKVGRRLDQGEDEQEQQKEGEEESAELSSTMKYAKVTRPASPEDDTSKPPPQHDEEGYAVVPEEIKMRKRAMSASKGVQQNTSKLPTDSTKPADQKADEKVKEAGKERSTSPEVVAITEGVTEHYAVVDVGAKKKKKKRKDKESPFVEIEIRRDSSVSPNPPPLPPMVDLGIDLSEFDQPPVPAQSEGVHHLVTQGGLTTSLAVEDPPYAKIKGKNDHPYAELDLAPKDSGPATLVPGAEDDDQYDTVGDVAAATPQDSDLRDKALGYDTVADDELVQERTGSSLEQEMPKLEPAADIPQQQMYDILDPVKPASPETGNVYDTLEPEPHQNGVTADDIEEEDRYEEIDEKKRYELRSQFQKRST